MFKEIARKTGNERGETLIEVLVSLLIICVCLVMLARSISAAIADIDISKEKMNEYYIANNALSTGLSDAEYEEGSINITSAGSPLKLIKGMSSTVSVKFYTNDVFEDAKVFAYVKK